MLNTLAEILPYAARRYGEKTALIISGKSITFNDLERISNRLANGLVSLGTNPGDRVTLYSPNCWEWVVSYYAVLKLGAVINPVNVMLTPEEVAYVTKDCGSSVLIGGKDKLEPIVKLNSVSDVKAIICYEEDVEGTLSFTALLNDQAGTFTPVEVDADTLSTICYTSGTTRSS